MPHHHDPERFAAILADFCASTESASLTRRSLAALDAAALRRPANAGLVGQGPHKPALAGARISPSERRP